MSNTSQWKEVWEKRFGKDISDHQIDRGTLLRNEAIETLSNEECVRFIEPQPDEVVFDAGCGSGVNMSLVQSKVKRIIGMDYSSGALARCHSRILEGKFVNVDLIQGDVTQLAIPSHCVDKVLCMSVFHYLNDAEVRLALREFARILVHQGTVVLHVKNLSSLYLSTLRLAKKIKQLLGGQSAPEHFRSFRWYINELESCGFEVVYYHSFNVFLIERMPRIVRHLLQRFELEHYSQFPLRTALIRRHGYDLKIRAKLT